MCCCLTCLRGQRSGDESASRPAPMSGRTTCDRHAIVEPCCHAASWSHCIATLNSPNSTPAAHNRRAHNMCVWGGVGVCWVCALDSPEVCLRSSRGLQHVPRLLQPAQPRCVVRTHIDSERPKTQKCTEGGGGELFPEAHYFEVRRRRRPARSHPAAASGAVAGSWRPAACLPWPCCTSLPESQTAAACGWTSGPVCSAAAREGY